jgi:ribosomal protein S10
MIIIATFYAYDIITLNWQLTRLKELKHTPIRMKIKHKQTVNRSPHVDKRGREQFEQRIYSTKIILDNSNVDATISFLCKSLVAGCTMTITTKHYVNIK